MKFIKLFNYYCVFILLEFLCIAVCWKIVKMINVQVAVGMLFGSVILAIFNVACMIGYSDYFESMITSLERHEYTAQALNDIIIDDDNTIHEFITKGLYTVEIIGNSIYIGCKDKKVKIDLLDFTTNFQIIK